MKRIPHSDAEHTTNLHGNHGKGELYQHFNINI